MKRWLITTTICLFLFCLEWQSSAQTTITKIQQTKLDSLFSSWDKEGSPGGVVAIVSKGKVIFQKGFGSADVRKKVKNTPETQFYIASMAKQFTGMCIALLAEAGKLSVEDDLLKYYPDFKFQEKITIKNLLDHSSGIREAYVLALLSCKVNLKGEVPEKYQTKEAMLKVLARDEGLNFKPGEEMVYTNINYILLGDIVEKVSGKSLRQFADSAIFQPLGMKNTLFDDDSDAEAADAAMGYLQKTETRFKKGKLKGGVVGDHNLVTTVEDLIRWDQNFYHNQLGKKDPQLIETVITSSTLNHGEPTRYGYGLWIGNYKGLNTVFHGGDNGLHTSCLLQFPEQQFSVICLANSSRYNDTYQKTYKVADIFLASYLNEPEKPEAEEFHFIKINPDELRNKTGLYTHLNAQGMGKLRKVSLKDSMLYISDSYYHDGLNLSPIDSQHFVAKNMGGEHIHIHFSSNDHGETTIKENFRDKEITFTQLQKTDSSPNFAEYAGNYLNSGVDATLKVKAKKDKIFARKGIIKIPLISFGKDVFYAPQNIATFHFKRNQQGKVNQIIVNAPDFRNFRFEKQ